MAPNRLRFIKFQSNFNLFSMKRFLLFGFAISLATILFFSCQKELSQESNLNNAVFSFHDDTSKACFPVVISGTYYNGVSAARDTNYIKVVVNVKSTGNYKISTDSTYGFYFSDSSFFSKTGLDTLILKAHGTPILVQNDHLSFPSDSLGSCGFDINVQDSTGSGLGGSVPPVAIDTSFQDPAPAGDSAWHFTDSISGKSFSGKLPTGASTVQIDNGVYFFELVGISTDGTQEFGFDIDLPSSTITTGVYPINDNNSLGLIDAATQNDIYLADIDAANAGSSYSYIRIDSYDAATKHAIGVFHCWATDANGNAALLKGSFNVYL